MILRAKNTFFLVSLLGGSFCVNAQIFDNAQKSAPPSTSRSIPVSSLGKIFSPMGATSFGAMDCGYYNTIAMPVYNSFGIQSAECMTIAQGISAPIYYPNKTVKATGLGERDYIDDAGRRPRGRFKRYLSNPYQARSYVDLMTDSPSKGSCVPDFEERDNGGDGSTVSAVYRERPAAVALSEKEREELNFELGPRPAWVPIDQEGPLVELPSPRDYDEVRNGDKEEFAMEKEIGYYRYGDSDGNVFGSERTIWNIKAAGKILAEKGIVMGVGEISSKRGPTKGHSEHQEGRDVDLRLIGKSEDGLARAQRCTVNNSSCYDRDNTYEMIKAFVDVDPYGIDKVFINDPQLRKMINSYMSSEYGISSNIAKSCVGHDNHVHVSFKRDGKDPDSY